MKRTSTRLTIIGTTILAGAAAGVSVAQAKEVSPAPALRPLSVFSGTWNCSGVSTSPTGSKTEFQSQATVSFIARGHLMRWREVSSVAGTTVSSAEYIWGWNARHHRFTVVGTYSAGLRTLQTTPGWVGNTMSTKGTTSQPSGQPFPSSTTFTRTGASTFTAKAEFWLNGTGGPAAESDSSCTR